MIKLTIFLLTILLSISAKKKGKDFFLVGDFGSMYDMRAANMNWDAMNKIKQSGAKCASEANGQSCPNDIDFFVSMGDNIYPRDAKKPSKQEVK